MPEEFKHEILEQELVELEEEMRTGGTIEKGKEAIKEKMSERIFGSPLPPSPTPSTSLGQAPPSQKTQGRSPLPSYAQELPAEAKFKAEKLLDFAWHKGIRAAVKEVKKSDPLTMDLFHDAITEKLYQEFKKRGILK